MGPLRRWWPEIVTGSCILLGTALALAGNSMPAFTDEGRAMAVFGRACDDSGPIEGWWRPLDAFRTYRDPLLNAGTGLLLAGATTLFLRVAMLVPRREGWPRIRTPQARWIFLAAGLGTVPLALAGSIQAIVLEQQRYMYPACADSIIIGIGGLVILAALLCPILLFAGYLISRSFGALPVALDHWDHARRRRSWIVTTLFGIMLAAAAAITASLLLSASALLMPAALIALHLLASTRAALLAPRIPSR